MSESTVKKIELGVRQRMYGGEYLSSWEVVSNVMYSDGTVSCIALRETETKEQAETIKEKYSRPGQGISAEVTVEMIQAAEKAQKYDYQALYNRFSNMLPVEVISECKEIMKIYDTLQKMPTLLALDSLNSDGFMQSMVFLESFCIRYLIDIFFVA